MRVLVIGANGKTGRRVVRQMKEGPHDPVAMVRDPEQRSFFTGLGVESVVGDVEESIAPLLGGIDAVIFAAGSGSKTGPEKTIDVDQNGAIRTIDEAEQAGIQRYVMLSSMNADPESEGHKISHYYRAKGVADEHLMESGLEWVIVRPGRLTDDPGREAIRAAPSLAGTEGPREISRDDVASVLVRSLDHPGVVGLAFEVLAGDVPIQRAMDRLGGWRVQDGEQRSLEGEVG
jgi:uncharacterized protein YbjT (DUF2867 family)